MIELKAWSPQRKCFINSCYPIGYTKNDILIISGVGEGEDIEQVEDDGLVFLQYTGIGDKTGKKIFDGDILHNEETNQWYKVFKVPGGFAINIHQDDLNKPDILFYEPLFDRQNSGWLNSLIIKGNIYQNPELLEQK